MDRRATAVLAIVICLVAAGCSGSGKQESAQDAFLLEGGQQNLPFLAVRGATQILDCPLWNISPWNARAVFGQSNGWWVYFDLNQNSTVLQGPARAYYPAPWLGGTLRYRGNVDGRVERSPELGQGGVRGDASINFSITWSGGAVGVYSGKISRWGYAQGTTWDLRNPASKASWTLNPSATSCT